MKKFLLLIGILISTTSLASAAISFQPFTNQVSEKPSFIKASLKQSPPQKKVVKKPFTKKKSSTPQKEKVSKGGREKSCNKGKNHMEVRLVFANPNISKEEKKGNKITSVECTRGFKVKSLMPLDVSAVPSETRADGVLAKVRVKKMGQKPLSQEKGLLTKVKGTVRSFLTKPKKEEEKSLKDTHLPPTIGLCKFPTKRMTFIVMPYGEAVRVFCDKKEQGKNGEQGNSIEGIGSQATSTNIGAGAESSSDDGVDAGTSATDEGNAGGVPDKYKGGPPGGSPTDHGQGGDASANGGSYNGDGREGSNDGDRYRGEDRYGEESALEKYKRQQEEKKREGAQEISSTDAESDNESTDDEWGNDSWSDDESVYPDDAQIKEIDPTQSAQGNEGKAVQESQFSEGDELVQRAVYNPNYAEYGDYPLEDNPVSQILEIDPSTQLFDNNIDFIGFEDAGFSEEDTQEIDAKYPGWETEFYGQSFQEIQYAYPQITKTHYDIMSSLYRSYNNAGHFDYNFNKLEEVERDCSWYGFCGWWWGGDGFFTNFWKPDTPAQPFLNNKSL